MDKHHNLNDQSIFYIGLQEHVYDQDKEHYAKIIKKDMFLELFELEENLQHNANHNPIWEEYHHLKLKEYENLSSPHDFKEICVH